MLGLEDLVCCGQTSDEEALYPPNVDNWDGVDDAKSTRESISKEKSGYSVKCVRFNDIDMWPSPAIHPLLYPTIHPLIYPNIHPPWYGSYSAAPLQDNFSVLKDLATALHARHAIGVIHGNLTPETIDIVDGRGILIDSSQTLFLHQHYRRPCARDAQDDDVYGARWAATELFRLDNDNPQPTKKSDVYSFACLMLQMLTASVPYCGTKRPEQVVYLKYLGREPIDTQTPKVADHYVAFMRWCWSLDPENRPSMETVVDFIHAEGKRLGDQRG